MKNTLSLSLFVILVGVCFGKPNPPVDLIVGEGLINPLGFHEAIPRFSWKLADTRFGAKQTAYQIEVIEQSESGDTIWDSGRIASEQSTYVPFGGEALPSRARVYWRIRYWDQEDESSPWSEWAHLETGLLSNDDWKAKWIHQPKVRDLTGIEIKSAIHGRGPFAIDLTDALKAEIANDPNRLFKIRVGEGNLFEREKRTGSSMVLTIKYIEDGEEREALNWDGQLIEIPPQPICNTPYFRNRFTLSEKTGSARIYVTARGIFELEINGKKVGNDAFTPGWTDYFQRIETLTYDVSDYLEEGENTIAARVAKGWYAGEIGPGIGRRGPSDVNRGLGGQIPEFLAQLEVELASGKSVMIVTDEKWEYYDQGPLVKSELYWGEDYDARREIPGWSTSLKDNYAFNSVEVSSLDSVKLEPKNFQTVSIQESLKPVSIDVLEKGRVIFDMGQNFVGWPEIDIPVKAGQKVSIRVAEMLNEDGSLYTDNYRNARSMATYMPAKDGVIKWHPTFTFFGYRYLELSGFDEKRSPSKRWLKGQVLHTGFKKSGHFTSSHEKLNQLQSNIEWGQRGNFLDIPTDCPQRNERLGWTGDAQVFSGTSLFNFDVHAFWMSWLRTLRGHQSEDGRLPMVAPNVGTFIDGPRLSPGWGDAIAIVPWQLYLRTGDTRPLEENFEAMTKYAALYERQSVDYIGPNLGHGDWLQPIAKEGLIVPTDSRFGSTPKRLISTAYSGYITSICAKVADVLGKPDVAERYCEAVANIRKAIRKEFFDEEGRLTTPIETQTGYVLFLAFDLVDEDLRPKLAAHLAVQVRKENNRLNTGFIGASHLNPVLDRHGYTEQAMDVLFTSEYPSWFYSIDQGATTIWERWNSYSHEDGFGDANMNSFNHYAYGAIGQWMYERLAGLAPDERGPGYKRILIQPTFDSPLNFAEASLETRYGKAQSRWDRKRGKIVMNVIIPANTSGTILIPVTAGTDVDWTNAPAGQDLKWESDGQIARSEVVSGIYRLEISKN